MKNKITEYENFELPDAIKDLLTFTGFHNAVAERTRVTGTKIDSFNYINSIHKRLFGFKKYANYCSYQKVLRDNQIKTLY